MASRTWAGGFAKAAGATNVVVIAPATTADPASFDPPPEAMAVLTDADFVRYAESDGFKHEYAGHVAHVTEMAPIPQWTAVVDGHDAGPAVAAPSPHRSHLRWSTGLPR